MGNYNKNITYLSRLLMDKIVYKAYKYALKKHKHQLDDSGKPYILHLVQVMEVVHKVAPTDSNLLAAALLHDTIEDTDVTYTDLEKKFGEDIANLVHEVTHEGQKDSKGYYFPRLHSQRGILLKFADRLSNLSRMDCWEEKRKNQYLRKSKFWASE